MQQSLDAIVISWKLLPSTGDLEKITSYRVILDEVNIAAMNISSRIVKFVNASSTQLVVDGLALGRTYNISLQVLSIHLPGPTVGPESIIITGKYYSYVKI